MQTIQPKKVIKVNTGKQPVTKSKVTKKPVQKTSSGGK